MKTHLHTTGRKQSPTYNSWRAMKARCYSEENIGYADYGLRGITVCDKWHDFEGFLEDMGERPEGHTLDSIDPTLGYFLKNCRWATPSTQARNKASIQKYSFNGKTLSFGEWSEVIGIERRTLGKRYYGLGWSIERVLTTPLLKHYEKKN